MSKERISEKILSDAENEGRAIEESAKKRGEEMIALAMERAEKERRETEREVKEKTKSVYEKKEASARLESSKILLLEKRKVIDGIYAIAKERLITLEKEEAVALATKLLTRYAEEGDEILFATYYKYVAEVALLPVVATKNLKISKDRANIDGGFLLLGKKADKDLSYGALLNADREAYQADLAREIFKTE